MTFHRSGARPERRRIPGDSVEDRGRAGRYVGQGRHQGHPDPIAVPAGAAYGFYLLGFCRGAWICRRSGGVSGCTFCCSCRSCRTRRRRPDRAGMYICMGVAALLLFHLLVNVGMVVGRMPVTGIPLPLMSSGGSNTLIDFYDAGAGEQCPAPAVRELGILAGAEPALSLERSRE